MAPRAWAVYIYILMLIFYVAAQKAPSLLGGEGRFSRLHRALHAQGAEAPEQPAASKREKR